MTHSEYLTACILNCRQKLAEPDSGPLPNGQMMHAHMREQLAKYLDEREDYALDHGRWCADGRFAGFAPGR